MASFVIEGGHKLHGEIHPQGAKNEVLQILCATLLTSEEVTVTNIPDILDVNNLIQLLRDMGVKVSKTGIDSYTFKADTVDLNYLESDEFLKKCSSLRGSVMLVGPLVARFGRALISKPGGDKIGRRRLDTHFIGIQKLGACFNYDEERSVFSICAEHLEGTYMLLDEASVTGTANIVMASVLAKGKTTIYNAACEPYLQQLCRMLNRMGAKISGIASNLLTIEGVESLHGCTHRVLPDMIEVGSFIGMAAMTGSELTIKNVSHENLGIIPESFRRLGIRVEQRGDDLFIPEQEHYQIESFIDGSIMTIADAPWPGLTPDLLSVGDCGYIRIELRRGKSPGRLRGKMDNLLPSFRHCQLVEYGCQHCQYFYHCHYSEILEEDSRLAHCHYRSDHSRLSDEDVRRYRLHRHHWRPFQH